jgi:hypothetical protein
MSDATLDPSMRIRRDSSSSHKRSFSIDAKRPVAFIVHRKHLHSIISMGNGLCTQSVVISDSLAIHIDAPAETVWGAILDFHEWPEFLSHVKALESQDGSMKVGTRFKEIRIYEGKEFFCNNTVTEKIHFSLL